VIIVNVNGGARWPSGQSARQRPVTGWVTKINYLELRACCTVRVRVAKHVVLTPYCGIRVGKRRRKKILNLNDIVSVYCVP
jgi:hypothetical protein